MRIAAYYPRVDIMLEAHHPVDAPVVGKRYRCIYNTMALYEAVIRTTRGCWATVEVVNPLPGPYEHRYKAGQQFDIRYSLYDLIECSG